MIIVGLMVYIIHQHNADPIRKMGKMYFQELSYEDLEWLGTLIQEAYKDSIHEYYADLALGVVTDAIIDGRLKDYETILKSIKKLTRNTKYINSDHFLIWEYSYLRSILRFLRQYPGTEAADIYRALLKLRADRIRLRKIYLGLDRSYSFPNYKKDYMRFREYLEDQQQYIDIDYLYVKSWNPDSAIPVLRQFLKDKNPEVQYRAASLLALFRDEKVLPFIHESIANLRAIIKAEQDSTVFCERQKEIELYEMLIGTLATLGDSTSIPLLIEFKKIDRLYWLKVKVEQLYIRRIYGKDITYNLKGYVVWWQDNRYIVMLDD